MDQGQSARLEEVRAALEEHMAAVKPGRYRHSLGVSQTAASLARTYGVDEYEAALAGLVHDWEKVLPDAEMLARAAQRGIEVCGSPTQFVGLLHGPLAAVELPEIFPDLSEAVLQAVERHTVGAVDMTPLDMVVYTADVIEPNRKGEFADRLRALVGKVSLTEFFFQCFTQGTVYVLQTGRLLYPTAVDIYNHYAAVRNR